MIALDTDTLIDVFKKNPSVLEVIKKQKEDICSTIINYAEIMFGLDLQRIKHIEEAEFYDNFFEGIFLFNLDKKASKNASSINWDLLRKGKKIGNFDCVIAGILLSNGVNKIMTRNIKNFERIPGIKVISY